MWQDRTSKKESWFAYDWKHDGKLSHSKVNCDFYDDASLRAKLPFVLYIQLLSKKAPQGLRRFAFSQSKLERCAAKLCNAATAEGIELVGKRETENCIELYFYSAKKETALALAKNIDQKQVNVSLRLAEDPDWQIYLHGIYPNMAQRQSVINKDYVQRLEKSGDSLHAIRRINHYLAFPNNLTRNNFCQAAQKAGYAIGEDFYATEDELPHGCIVRNRSDLSLRHLNQYSTELCMLAEKQQGLYIHWDCPTVKKISKDRRKRIIKRIGKRTEKNIFPQLSSRKEEALFQSLNEFKIPEDQQNSLPSEHSITHSKTPKLAEKQAKPTQSASSTIAERPKGNDTSKLDKAFFLANQTKRSPNRKTIQERSKSFKPPSRHELFHSKPADKDEQ